LAEEQLQLMVEQAHDGLRLDRYVAETVTDLSRTYARQLIEDRTFASTTTTRAQARPCIQAIL